jgi:hypothetical protein
MKLIIDYYCRLEGLFLGWLMGLTMRKAYKNRGRALYDSSRRDKSIEVINMKPRPLL